MIKVAHERALDENGVPTRQIGEDDREVMSMEPDLIGGFNTTVGYKGFDLTIIGAFQIGGKLISAIHSANGYLNMLMLPPGSRIAKLVVSVVVPSSFFIVTGYTSLSFHKPSYL